MSSRQGSIAIAFAGPIASGKSTLSASVSDTFGWPLASFGDFVRRVAEACGLDQSRKSLQFVGDALVNHACRAFCEAVLRVAGWRPGVDLVVEGIRHLEALETLESIVLPSRLYLVYVSLGDAERRERLRARRAADSLSIEELERHPTEEQVKTILFNRADFVLDNDRPEEVVATEIVEWIRSLRT